MLHSWSFPIKNPAHHIRYEGHIIWFKFPNNFRLLLFKEIQNANEPSPVVFGPKLQQITCGRLETSGCLVTGIKAIVAVHSFLNSPIRLVRVVDPPVVPHPNIRGAGVVAHVALVHLLHSTFYNRGQTKDIYSFLKKRNADNVMLKGQLWQQREPECHSSLYVTRTSWDHVLPSSVTRSPSSTMAMVSVTGVRSAVSPLQLWCSLSWVLNWL